MERIVVGVDGSDASVAALRWAIAEARLRGAEVDALHAWSYPVYGYTAGVMPAPIINREELADGARLTLDQVCDSVDAGDVVVHRVVEEGPAAALLLDAAEGATLLVVGSRGHGGFTGLLLGSVSQHLAHHAPCPFVIVR